MNGIMKAEVALLLSVLLVWIVLATLGMLEITIDGHPYTIGVGEMAHRIQAQHVGAPQ